MSRIGLSRFSVFRQLVVCGLMFPSFGVAQEPVHCWENFDRWLAFESYGTIFYDQTTLPPNDDWYESNVLPTLTPAAVGWQGSGGDYVGVPTGSSEVRVQTSVGVPAGQAPYNLLYAPEFAFIQSGDFRYRREGLIECESNNFYMYQWTVSNNRTQAQVWGEVETIRFRMGSPTAVNVGCAVDELNRGTNSIAGDRTFRSYFYAQERGRMMAALDVLDLSSEDIGTDIKLSKVEVFKFSRASLEESGGTIVFNQGAASFPTADGTVPPTEGRVDFDLVNTWSFGALNSAASASGAARPVTEAGTTSSQLVLDMSAIDAHANNMGFWDTSKGSTTDFIQEIKANNGQLLVLDVWMRSPDALTFNNKLPGARIQFTANRVYNGAIQQESSSQGRTAYLEWDASNTAPLNSNGDPDPSYLYLESASRRYTLAIEPQLVSGETEMEGYALIMMSAFDCFPDFDENGQPDFATDGDRNGTFIIDRVVATVYDFPAGRIGTLGSECD